MDHKQIHTHGFNLAVELKSSYFGILDQVLDTLKRPRTFQHGEVKLDCCQDSRALDFTGIETRAVDLLHNDYTPICLMIDLRVPLH